jgi:chromosome segregation ATPase
MIVCPRCRARNEDGRPACLACGADLTAAGTGRGQTPGPIVDPGETVVQSQTQEERVAEEVRLVEARFADEVASLRERLDAANKLLAERVADTDKAAPDAPLEREQAVKARVAEEVKKVETRVAAETETLRNALADAIARGEEAAKRLAHIEKRPGPVGSNASLLLAGSIAVLAVALFLFVFRPHPAPRPEHYSARYDQLEQQLSDAHDAANGYQVRIAALQDQVAALRTRLKNDDKRVETLRSDLAEAQARPATTSSDPSQAAAVRNLRKELATEQNQLKAARTAFVNVQHSRDEALAELARLEGR